MTAVIVRTVIPKATVHTVTHTRTVTHVMKHQAWSNPQQIVQKPLTGWEACNLLQAKADSNIKYRVVTKLVFLSHKFPYIPKWRP